MRLLRIVPIASAALLVGSMLVSCGGSKQTSSTPTGGPVPLAEALATLPPHAVWQHFYDLTQVPRPSHHEQKATALVAAFGRELGLATTIDRTGNVIIREPATPGMQGRPGVVLQAHLDMVPQKKTESPTNFETDPIKAVVDDGWVHAEDVHLWDS